MTHILDHRVKAIGREIKRGEDEKIDAINDYILLFKTGDREAGYKLYECYEGMLTNLVKKWSIYYNDESHVRYEQEELEQDIKYWFIRYLMKFQPKQGVIFSVYIKKIMDTRVRFMYQTRLKELGRQPMVLSDINEDELGCTKSVEEEMFSTEKNVDRVLLGRKIFEILTKYSNDKRACKRAFEEDERLCELLDKQGLSIEPLIEMLNDRKTKLQVAKIMKDL